MNAEAKAVHLSVSGRVQGVFYRSSAREQAVRLGLAGWVRNRGDGTVEAHAQGPPALVDAFVEWCRSGPPMAEVDDLVFERVEVDRSLAGFGVRPGGP